MQPLSSVTIRYARGTLPCRIRCRYLRAFSTSRIRKAYFPPAFEQTASPDIDELLETIRRKVLLPTHLHGDHRKLVSDPERSQALLEEDVRLKIGEQEVRLEPHSYSNGGVSARKSFTKLRHLSKTHDDFSFWPQLLRGYSGARFRLPRDTRESLMMTACQHGHIDLVFSWFEQARQTEFYPTINSVFQLTHAIRHQALFADISREIRNGLPDLEEAKQNQIFEVIRSGKSTKFLLREMPGLSAIIVQSLQRGLKRAIRFNLLVAKPDISKWLSRIEPPATKSSDGPDTESRMAQAEASQDELQSHSAHKRNYYAGIMTLNDPLLAAVPLEMQSKIEALIAVDPTAINPLKHESSRAQSVSASTLPPARQVNAADYATRLLHTLEKESITASTIPPSNSQHMPIKARDLLAASRINWVERAFAVTSALRAASTATSVQGNTRLLQHVKSTLAKTETMLFKAVPTILDDIGTYHQYAWVSVVLDAYRNGLEYGIFGEENVDGQLCYIKAQTREKANMQRLDLQEAKRKMGEKAAEHKTSKDQDVLPQDM